MLLAPTALSLRLALSFHTPHCFPMAAIPQGTIHGRQSQPPPTPTIVIQAESLFFFCDQDCLANGRICANSLNVTSGPWSLWDSLKVWPASCPGSCPKTELES